MTLDHRLYPWAEHFGAASLVELSARYQEHLQRFDRDGATLCADFLATLRAQLEFEHRARYGAVALLAERADELDRDAAVNGDTALVRYEAKWRRKLARLQRARALARERAERSLSRPQRAWLAALERSANAGAFFESSGLPNLSAASRVLGKDRSSAQRAYRELRGRFIEELNRLE